MSVDELTMLEQDFHLRALRETLHQLRTGTIHDPDYSALATLGLPVAPRIMDVGANRGQSIASLKTLFPDAIIDAFEANPVFFPVLVHLQDVLAGSVVVHEYGLSSRNAVLELAIPWVGDTPYLEEASTRRDYFDKPWVAERFLARGEVRFESVDVHVRVGDELGLSPDVVKIDVEGAEHDVLVGLRDTVRIAHPVLMVENSAWHAVTPWLADLGYAPFRWMPDEQRLVPFFGATTNTFYLHHSRALPVRP